MMTNRLKLSQAVLLGLCFTTILPRLSDGFNGNAHDRLSRLAVDPTLPNASQLDSFLKSTLSFEFENGVEQAIQGGQGARDLIAQGSVDEDKPASRALNHFHDPTKPWNLAGFNGTGASSIVWSQLPFQQVGFTRTWKTARDAYFNALTSTTSSQRKQWYAETFRTLGHLIHHVQDAAVPAHTRNDNHFAPSEKSTFPLGDRFHTWADNNLATIDESIQLSGILSFTPSVLNQTSANPLAPVPVARIIDKTDGDFGVLSPNFNIGLAEYSNANFFSEHTILSTAYQYPRLSQLQIGNLEPSPNNHQRRYLRFQSGFGEQNYRVSTYSTMLPYGAASLPLEFVDVGLDNNVFKDYGLKLFPRAIGYSAGLIDYFFRGRITTKYNIPTYNYFHLFTQTPIAQKPNYLRVLDLSIHSVDGIEQAGPGELRVVLIKRGNAVPPSDEVFPEILVSQPVMLNGGPLPPSIDLPFSVPLPFPGDLGSASFRYIEYWAYTVFRGTLGQESDAVIAGGYCDNGNASSLAFGHSLVNFNPIGIEDPNALFLFHLRDCIAPFN